MSEAGKIPEPIQPKCPHCQKAMPMLGLYPFEIGKIIFPTLMCPWCQTLLSIQMVIPPEAKQPADPEKSPLWKPS